MGNLFSPSKKKPKITDADRAVLELKLQRRRLADYQKRVLAVIAREKEAAKELLKQNKKDRALLALKKKRLQEEMLEKVDTWMLTVEEQLNNIETASRQAEVFASLKIGNKALKDLQSQVSIDDVERLMDDTADAHAYHEELTRALGEQLSAEDEEAVLAEFENLESELGMADFPEVPPEPAKIPEKFPKKIPVTAAAPTPTPAPKVAVLEGEEDARETKEEAPLPKEEEEEEEEELDLPDVPKTPPKILREEVEEESEPTAVKRRVLEEPLAA